MVSANFVFADTDPQPDQVVGPALRAAYGQDLATAERLLKELATADNPDPLVLWNLAAVQARRKKLGASLVSMMRLLKLNVPQDLAERTSLWKSRIQDRLLERARLSGSLEVLTMRDPRSFSEKWLSFLPEHGWSWLSLVSFWAILSLLLLRRVLGARARVFLLSLTILLSTVFLVSLVSESVKKRQGDELLLGVVTRNQAEFRESLVQGAPVQPVPEGVIFVVKSKITSELLLIRLPDGREGYLSSRDAGLVL